MAVRGVRGATTVENNTFEEVRQAVLEIMGEIEQKNQIDPSDIVSAMFSVTPDLNAVFPAKIARSRPHWEYVPLMDVQHMYVPGDLEKCIRILLQVNTNLAQIQIQHIYLHRAKCLRPDL
ncbi:MAG: chorismate mutase [Pseudanabaenaceae cyanobacterium bins.68]|nr:chorismate mutase [Pseudanabaenaceae cyanobacterium bins.68]